MGEALAEDRLQGQQPQSMCHALESRWCCPIGSRPFLLWFRPFEKPTSFRPPTYNCCNFEPMMKFHFKQILECIVNFRNAHLNQLSALIVNMVLVRKMAMIH